MAPKIILITGRGLQHHYFINRLNRELPVECVFLEEVDYPDFTSHSQKYQDAWEWFFRRRNEYEENMFGDSVSWERKNEPQIVQIKTGQLNSKKVLKILQAQEPDIIILFGSSLLKREMLKNFPNRILNLHIGLSDQYRGSSCNFWPIYDGRLDCLGATLLMVNEGIDTGEIIARETIQINEGDTEQSLMGKPLILGMDLTVRIAQQWFDGRYKPIPIERKGKLYQKKDFTPEAAFKVREMVESGQLANMIQAHLKSQEKAI